MKIEVNEEFNLVLKEVYNGVLMETAEGNRIGISMRDDTFEINVLPKGDNVGKWHRVDMGAKEIPSFS